MGYFK